MKLGELIQGVGVLSMDGSADVEVTDLVYDAGAASAGSCFFALRGARRDGHDFVASAVDRGASVVVSERPVDRKLGVANVVVSDSKDALGIMSARILGDPSSELTVVGITGTNGKTTTAYLMESIFAAAGKKPGVVGTIEYRFAGRSEAAPHTTPFSIELQRLLRRMRDGGCDCCAMEVSSHALEQRRVTGCRFDAGIFTNLSPEHLDYHGEMESYFAAKSRLFERVLSEGGKPDAFAAVNADDDYGRRIAERSGVPTILYGLSRGARVRGEGISFSSSGLTMRVVTPAGSFDVRSMLCGRFNARNILAATAAAYGLGIDIDAIRRGVEAVSSVPGRFESVPNDRGVLALVDYAHTPDALSNSLTHAKELISEPGGRLIVVFGCGGDRDRAKRPLMGEIAAGIADIAIVTSDNPRTEDPQAIIDQILPGVKRAAAPFDGEGGYEVIVDRRRAIARGSDLAGPGDVLVVAGKGHEDYQIIGTTKHSFDDRQELAASLGG